MSKDAKGERWKIFFSVLAIVIVTSKLVGYLLWRDPLNSHLPPVLITGLLLAWFFAFPPWRRGRTDPRQE